MPLKPGVRLGPYEIVAPLDAGGMGEVFRARDTRLGREVAVKVLPRGLAADPERRLRFQREARAISGLQHPNICALFDVGSETSADGPVDFIVMELLAGETLARRIEKGALKAAEVVPIGIALAEALAAAHERGIVHRDLKPGNVMLTRAGTKLLDFGLARDAAVSPSDAAGSEVRTQARSLTREGVIVGTWPYLAPEQLRGQSADARSDLFALGAVLYEALAGRRAFQGATASDLQAAILREEPADLRSLAPSTPAALVSIVRTCLAKEPAARWQSAGDVARGLRLVADAAPEPNAAAAVRSRLWPAVALSALAATAASVALLAGRTDEEPDPLRFTITAPEGVPLGRPTLTPLLSVSPDGRRIAFVGHGGLWVWTSETGAARRLDGTAEATAPFFSPDGAELAFFQDDELQRLPLAGGRVSTIVRAPAGSAGSWGTDGTILYNRWIGEEAGLWRVSAGGGEPRVVAPAANPVELRAFPSFLPDGRHYLYVQHAYGMQLGARQTCVASLDGGEPSCFAACDSNPAYAGNGYLLCVRRGALVAFAFDPGARRPSGQAVTVADDIRWFGPTGVAVFAVSADGRVLVYGPHARPPKRLVWHDRGGRRLSTVGAADRYDQIALAPDGRRVTVEIGNLELGSTDIWLLDVVSGVPTRLTIDPIDSFGPSWSPDGRRLAFSRPAPGPPDIFVLDLAGSAEARPLLAGPGVQQAYHWSPDGRLIAYVDFRPELRHARQVELLSLDGGHRRLRDAPASTFDPRFSPDGGRIAYVSDESGRGELYVMDLRGGGLARRLSPAGAFLPRWREDGRELYFLQPDGMLMVVDPSAPVPVAAGLFRVEGVSPSDNQYPRMWREIAFDAAPDGQRFLISVTERPWETSGLRVATGWTQGLRGGPAGR